MAAEEDQQRGTGGAHAAGWALRWRKHLRAPLHAIARPFHRAIWVLSAALVATLSLFGGTAYAYFSGAGSGSGAARVGTLEPITVTATAMASSTLLPGRKADLALHVYNPNGFSVTITAVAPDTGVTGITGGTGCTAANAAVSVVATTGLSFVLGAAVTTTVHVPTGVAMATDSYTGCQGATFHLPVTLTVKK